MRIEFQYVFMNRSLSIISCGMSRYMRLSDWACAVDVVFACAIVGGCGVCAGCITTRQAMAAAAAVTVAVPQKRRRLRRRCACHGPRASALRRCFSASKNPSGTVYMSRRVKPAVSLSCLLSVIIIYIIR